MELFDEIFGVLQSECGYTPKEIREMTILDVQRLSRYWNESPPLRVLVRVIAAALGVKLNQPGNPDAKKEYLTDAEFARLVQITDGGRVI